MNSEKKYSHTVLVIDDELGIREVFTDILQDEGYRVLTAADGLKGLELLRSEIIDLVFLDVWLPGMGGIDVLAKILEEYPFVKVAVISGHANVELAVNAIKMGAYDMLEKPLSMERILRLCKNVFELETLRRENKSLKAQLSDEMLGKSPKILQIRSIIEQAANSAATVLISGENGTGKELVAREIHNRSARQGNPFIAVNCAAIPENLIESELFGHERGSFTGAVAQKKGKFEIASGGTLFLDEVADLALSAQAKILRAIQEMRIERVGGEQVIVIDVRIIAATNKNMQDLVSKGQFREDLYYRLHVVGIDVPPLRERIDDIELIALNFLQNFSGSDRSFAPDAITVLKNYAWPGNIRQLKNIVQRLSILSDESEIHASFVEQALQSEMDIQDRFNEDGLYHGMGLVEARESFEAEYIQQKLKNNNYNITKTAQELGVYPSNLHNKIRKYGIIVDKRYSHPR